MKHLFTLSIPLFLLTSTAFGQIPLKIEAQMDAIMKSSARYVEFEDKMYDGTPDGEWIQFAEVSNENLNNIRTFNSMIKEKKYLLDLAWLKEKLGPEDMNHINVRDFFAEHLPASYQQLFEREAEAFIDVRTLWKYTFVENSEQLGTILGQPPESLKKTILKSFFKSIQRLDHEQQARALSNAILRMDLYSSRLTEKSLAEGRALWTKFERYFIAQNLENKYVYHAYVAVLAKQASFASSDQYASNPANLQFIDEMTRSMQAQRIPNDWVKRILKVLEKNPTQQMSITNWLGFLFGGYGGPLPESDLKTYVLQLEEYIQSQSTQQRNRCNLLLRTLVKLRKRKSST